MIIEVCSDLCNYWQIKQPVTDFNLATTWENRIFAYVKTKTQISLAVTVKLISVFVFATRIVQSLYFLNPKFRASSHLLWLYSPVCVVPGREPRRPVFSRRGSIGVCNEVRIHQSVTPINRLTREKVLIMKTDELLRCRIYICRVFTVSSCFMHPLW